MFFTKNRYIGADPGGDKGSRPPPLENRKWLMDSLETQLRTLEGG